jgi:hypothetical protein
MVVIVDNIMTKNPCYTAGKKIEVKGLMLHSVGCNQPNASVFVNSWNNASFNSACVHAFIDAKTGDVHQTLPWNHRGWHAGGYANNTHIGVEMCEPDCIKYTQGAVFTCSDEARAKEMVQRTYKSAVELFAHLCEKYNLDPMKKGVIISHNEGFDMGWATNHADPEHIWKQLGTGYTMDGFRKAVNDLLKEETSAGESAPVEEKTRPDVIWNFLKGWLNNDYGVAGLMGNLDAESGLNPINLENTANIALNLTDAEYTAQVDAGTRTFEDSAGYGLAQWTYYTRKRNLLNFAKSRGCSIGCLRTQLEFLKKEMEESFPSLVQTLKNAKSVAEASTAVLTIYERPADMGESVKSTRAKMGQVYFDRYTKKTVTQTPTAPEKETPAGYPATPFLVTVLIPNLNIRSTPSMNGTVKGVTKKGTFTITEVRNGWGKLKSGAGWIYLENPSYCKIQ